MNEPQTMKYSFFLCSKSTYTHMIGPTAVAPTSTASLSAPKGTPAPRNMGNTQTKREEAGDKGRNLGANEDVDQRGDQRGSGRGRVAEVYGGIPPPPGQPQKQKGQDQSTKGLEAETFSCLEAIESGADAGDGPLRKDGQPDRCYNTNKEPRAPVRNAEQSSHPTRKDGTADTRFKDHKPNRTAALKTQTKHALDNYNSSNTLGQASDAKADIDANGTPAYILQLAPIIDWTCYLSSLLFTYIFGFLLFAYQIYFGGFFLTWKRTGSIILLGYCKLLLTFGVMHRFFGHKTFCCSRPVAFILGLLASAGAQRGPLWWGSKHVRHHKYCENEGDPHSWRRSGSWLYAYVGWTVWLPERKVDWEYVHAEFKQPEMVLLEFLSAFVPPGEMLLWYYRGGIESALMEYYATIVGLYVFFSFNVAVHHDNLHEEEPVNGRYKCRANDRLPWYLKYTLDFIGEMDHYDHHRYPRRALHPSYVGVDLTYWVLIWPFEKLGIFYNVNHDGRGRNRRHYIRVEKSVDIL